MLVCVYATLSFIDTRYLAIKVILMQILLMKVSFPKWWMRCKEWKKSVPMSVHEVSGVKHLKPSQFHENSPPAASGVPLQMSLSTNDQYTLKCRHSNGKRMQKVIFIWLDKTKQTCLVFAGNPTSRHATISTPFVIVFQGCSMGVTLLSSWSNQWNEDSPPQRSWTGDSWRSTYGRQQQG